MEEDKWSVDNFQECHDTFYRFLKRLEKEQKIDPDLMIPVMFGMIVDLMINLYGIDQAKEIMGRNLMAQCRYRSDKEEETTLH